MALYEYRCRECCGDFEQIVFGDQKATCPDCGSSDSEKLLSTFSVGAGGRSSGSMSRPAFQPGGA